MVIGSYPIACPIVALPAAVGRFTSGDCTPMSDVPQ